MADNKTVDNGALTDIPVATLEATFSGDVVDVQGIALLHVTGAEGSRTAALATVAEDAAHASGDPGLQLLAVRRDVEASSAGSDGDYTPLHVDKNGRLYATLGSRIAVAQTPTLSTSIYAAGDQYGTVMTFADAAIANGGKGAVVGCAVTNRDVNEYPMLELHLFRVSPTMVGSDNAAFDITDANLEAAGYLGTIEVSTYYATSSGSMGTGSNRGAALSRSPIEYVCDGSSTSIYGVMCIRNAVTQASTTDVVVELLLDRG